MEAMKPANKGKTFWYLAPTYKQGKDVVWNNKGMLDYYIPREIIKKKNETELWIRTTNDSIIYVKGADNPDSLLGTDPFGIIMDETQAHKRDTYFRLIKPILDANGGWIWFLGTPRIKDFFYEMYTQAQDDVLWQAITLSAEDSKIIPEKQLLKTKKSIPIDIYRQDYLAEFLENEGAVFRNIDKICVLSPENPINGHTYSIGVDLARKQDFTVISVFDRCQQRQVYQERFRDVDWRIQKMEIANIARKYHSNGKPSEIKIDSTGVGDPIYQDLRDDGLFVRPIVFTNKLKEDLVTNMQIKFDHKQILCLKDWALMGELAIFEESVTPSGRRRFSHPQNGHDDTVLALALAIYQAGKIEPKKKSRNNLTMNKYKSMGNRYAPRRKSIYNLSDLS